MPTREPPPVQAAGVFETLLVSEGRPIELDAHLARLAGSSRELFGEDPPHHLAELAREHAGGLRLGRLRLTVSPSQDGLSAEAASAAVEAADVFPGWERAVELRGFLLPGGLGAHKWVDRRALATLQADLPDGCLPLLLDSGEEVLEASRSNVFALEGEVLLTPRADGRILPGVARAHAIEAARSLGLEVREQELGLQRLTEASAVFLTNSVRGVEPVRAVERTRLAQAGETVGLLAAAVRRRWVGDGERWAAPG